MIMKTAYQVNTTKWSWDNEAIIMEPYDIITVYVDHEKMPPNTFSSLSEAHKCRRELLMGEIRAAKLQLTQAEKRLSFFKQKLSESPTTRSICS